MGNEVLYHQPIVAGDTWSCVIKRGQRLELQDPSGQGNCTMLAFNARNTSDRYNMPDTLKGQHTAHLTAGHCLYSDMGRVLLSIVEDERGWHDPLGGYSNRQQVESRYGGRSYQQHRNKWTRNTRDNLIVELGKHGLDIRDLHGPVNWFTTVVVQQDGTLTFDTSRRAPGHRVVLRADLDVLVLLSATPHPLEPGDDWQPQPIQARLLAGEPASADDLCRVSCGENTRAFELTDLTALAY